MKQFMTVLLCGLIMAGCAKNPGSTEPGNSAPSVPSNPSPPDRSVAVSPPVGLAWSCSDPDPAERLHYDVVLNSTTPPAKIWASGLSNAQCTAGGLGKNRTYYWRVVARNSKGLSTQGPIWRFTTISDYALDFDGTDDIVTISPTQSLQLTSAITMEAWVNYKGVGTAMHFSFIIAKTGEYGLGVYRDGQISFALNTASPGWGWISTGTTLSVDTWTHIAIVYAASGGTCKAFINGIKVYETAMSGAIEPWGIVNHFSLGNSDIGDGPFLGIIDEVRIWSSALSDATVRRWMDRTVTSSHPDSPSLAGYWTFDEGRGASVSDHSGNGNVGTISGNSWVVSTVPLVPDSLR